MKLLPILVKLGSWVHVWFITWPILILWLFRFDVWLLGLYSVRINTADLIVLERGKISCSQLAIDLYVINKAYSPLRFLTLPQVKSFELRCWLLVELLMFALGQILEARCDAIQVTRGLSRSQTSLLHSRPRHRGLPAASLLIETRRVREVLVRICKQTVLWHLNVKAHQTGKLLRVRLQLFCLLLAAFSDSFLTALFWSWEWGPLLSCNHMWFLYPAQLVALRTLWSYSLWYFCLFRLWFLWETQCCILDRRQYFLLCLSF